MHEQRLARCEQVGDAERTARDLRAFFLLVSTSEAQPGDAAVELLTPRSGKMDTSSNGSLIEEVEEEAPPDLTVCQAVDAVEPARDDPVSYASPQIQRKVSVSRVRRLTPGVRQLSSLQLPLDLLAKLAVIDLPSINTFMDMEWLYHGDRLKCMDMVGTINADGHIDFGMETFNSPR